MPEIFFPSRNVSAQELSMEAEIQQYLKQNNALSCNGLTAQMPYCLDIEKRQSEAKVITRTLSTMDHGSRNNLMCLIDNLGQNTAAYAKFFEKHLENFSIALTESGNIITLTGAAATASSKRLTLIQEKLLNYAKAINALENNVDSGKGAFASRMMLQQKIKSTYADIQKAYHIELKALGLTSNGGRNRGHAINSPERAITLAQGNYREGKKGRLLNVVNSQEAASIKKMASGVNFIGNKLTALDAISRGFKVHNTYNTGGNWQKEASLQMTGFGIGGAAGYMTGTYVIAALSGLALAATPIGWVIVLGLGIAAGFAAANIFDNIGQGVASTIWTLQE